MLLPYLHLLDILKFQPFGRFIFFDDIWHKFYTQDPEDPGITPCHPPQTNFPQKIDRVTNDIASSRIASQVAFGRDKWETAMA